MKKVLLIFSFLFLFSFINVDANDLMIDIKELDNSFVLEYHDGNQVISFKEAKEKYQISDYTEIMYNNSRVYFFEGNLIDEATYTDGINEQYINNLIKNYDSYGIRVKTTDEAITTIKKIYEERNKGEYHLIYSNNDKKNIDFNQVNEFLNNNYIALRTKNTFNYQEHGLYILPKSIIINDNEIIINVNPILSKKEEEYVNEFIKELKTDLSDLNDISKIHAVYSYLSKTIRKCEDADENNCFSAYNALIERSASSIGIANAFQAIMESIGIESYIIDDIKIEEDNIITSHTFNVVYVDRSYYIVDINLNDYLVGNKNKYTLSNGITISETDHENTKYNFDIDYKKYDKLVNDILIKVQKENSIKDKNDALEIESYILLITILVLIMAIIIHFTRMDR